jgi:hypothetical protein
MFRSHAWEDFTPAKSYKPPPWGITFHFRCIRCATARHDTIDALGDLSARRYEYPDEYRLPADETPTTQQLRLQHVDDLSGPRRRTRSNPKRRRVA